ncbi:hypothetical protein [Tsukamurella tyrosinosolvens]|uniref:hypothetical protein n=1 Tax=Tsukamurella tyrosinosolvens TaxID=57704 RepID=UPI0034629CA2
MTVAELIEKLQSFPPDAPLVWYCPANNPSWEWVDYDPDDNFGSMYAPKGTVSLGVFD